MTDAQVNTPIDPETAPADPPTAVSDVADPASLAAAPPDLAPPDLAPPDLARSDLAPSDLARSDFGPSDPGSSVQDQVAPLSREPDEAALRLAEAVVFASVVPMTARGLSQLLPDDMDAAAVIAAVRSRYEGRGIELVEIGGGLRFRTAADLAPRLSKVVQVPRRLPRVALETLAIVAYHQPITRPEIEDMRGTGLAQQTLDVLL